MNKISLSAAAVALTAAAFLPQILGATEIIRITMDVDNGSKLTETVSGTKIPVYSVHTPENIAGAAGKALRLDGYSTYATGTLPEQNASGQLTVTLWAAPETYPIVKHDVATNDKIMLAGTLDDTAKKGWGFMLGSTGKYSFACYTGGWRVDVEADDLLPRYEWSCLTATCDGQKLSLYRNGTLMKEVRALGNPDNSSRTLYLGKGPEYSVIDGFNLNAFNGLLDDLTVYDTCLDGTAVYTAPENPADLTIPSSRFADDLLRPRLHGMPAAGWTNESHGMAFSDGKYHLFFQKNANGPYMSRLHWGHISSPDLINWTEEKMAIFPDKAYDVKGCWSGCVFSDEVLTGGRPNIIYTAVDYVKATMAQAAPDDDGLVGWRKLASNPIINGRPAGLSDDFRDPYFFRNGDNAYLIVGTSKDGVGAVTLHKYVPLAQTWTNTAGDIFFAGTDKASCGTFWEMPNITDMGGGKWLFTTTPQNTGIGVRTLYWTGSINPDGTFSPDAMSASPRGVELISRDGYGLLSPTIFQKDGKTIALGIVPDKLPSNINYNLGWAHCYSLPREWSLDSKGNLIQKPYEGLKAARSSEKFSQSDFTLNGSIDLAPVEGRQAELMGRFTVGNAPFGFRFFKSGSSEAVIKYLPAANMLMVDFTRLDRHVNDSKAYNGSYTCILPEPVAAGSELKLNLFIDGSVLDIFVNDKWATSIRVFPAASDADGIEAFAEGEVKVSELSAWNLKFGESGVETIPFDFAPASNDGVDVIDLDGRILKRGVAAEDAADGLPAGIYIINGKKIMVR